MKKPVVAWLRHPVTHRQMRIVAATKRELASLVAIVDEMRREFRQRRKVGGSTDDLEEMLAKAEHGPITLKEAASAYAARRHLSPSTVRRVRSFMAHTAPAVVEIAQLTGPAVKKWIESLRARKLAESTIASHWRTLTAITRFATENGWIAHSPWGAYRPVLRGAQKLRHREAARTVEEIVLLLNAACELDDARARGGRIPDLEAKIAFASCLGLRQSELAHLRWSDLGTETVQVSEAKRPGGIAERYRVTMQADPALLEIAERYRQKLEALQLYAPDGPIFPYAQSLPGAPQPYAGREVLARGDLRSVVRLAQLPNPEAWSAHSLRDTFVTLEAQALGGDLAAVAKRSRHDSHAALVRYLQTRCRDVAHPGFLLPAPQK